MAEIKKFDKPVRVKTLATCYYGNRIYEVGQTFYLKAGDILGSYMEVMSADDTDEGTDVNGDGKVSELEALSVKKLKELADAEAIDLGEAGNKAEIIDAITAARAAKADPLG